MEFANAEALAVEQVVTDSAAKDVVELDCSHLALIGGGIAEVILG